MLLVKALKKNSVSDPNRLDQESRVGSKSINGINFGPPNIAN
jgi:hypothetical protein